MLILLRYFEMNENESETDRTSTQSNRNRKENGDFMTKKSDVHRHTSTGSREDRKINRPYGANSAPIKSKPMAVPAEVKAKEMPAKPAK